MITGKFQTPSEAMNIKNKWGALAVDIIADPVNLLGLGLLAKGKKALKGYSVADEVGEAGSEIYKHRS